MQLYGSAASKSFSLVMMRESPRISCFELGTIIWSPCLQVTVGGGKPLALHTRVTCLVLFSVNKVVPIATDTGLVVGQVLFAVEDSMLGRPVSVAIG